MDISLSELNGFDITILSFILLISLVAFFKGFVGSLMVLLTWSGSSLITFFAHKHAFDAIKDSFDNENIASVVAYGGLFVISFICLYLIGKKIAQVLGKIGFNGFFDKSLGGAVGLVFSGTFVCAIFMSISLMSQSLGMKPNEEGRVGPEWFVKAKSYNMLKVSSVYGISFVPEEFRQKIEDSFDQISEEVPSPNVKLKAALDSDVAKENLNEEEKQIMSEVIESLPEDEVEDIYLKYNYGEGRVSGLENRAILRELLESYINSELVDSGKITDSELISLLSTIESAKTDENIDDNSEELGYKERQIKEIDRLIDTLN